MNGRRAAPLAPVLILGLLLAACGGSAAPAKTAPAPGSSAAQPGAASASGSASAKPAADQKKLTFVYDSAKGEDDLVSMVGFAELRQQGWQIQSPALAKNELAVTEVANNRANMGSASIDTVTEAVDKGAPLTIIWGYKENAWTVVAKSSIKSVKQLSGQRLGIHSLASFTNAMAHYLINTYHITPQVPIVPGSHPRELALIHGSLDATFLELPDQVDILTNYPSKFHVIWTAATAVPGLTATVLFARKDWLATHGPEAQAVIEQLMKVSRHAKQDPAWMSAQAAKYFPHESRSILAKMVQALVAEHVWPAKNRWTKQAYETTLKFFEKYRGLKLKGNPLGGSSARRRPGVLYISRSGLLFGLQL